MPQVAAVIPQLNREGNLPVGVHVAEEKEFFDRFGAGSARRRWLGGRLRELLARAKSSGHLERVMVWGSFVSAKESPNDVDLLLVMKPEFRLEAAPEACKVVLDYATARISFNADVFWTKSSIGEAALRMWLDTYQTTRDFKRRGIVELKQT